MDLTVSILKCRFVELSVNIDLAPGQMSGFARFRGYDNFFKPLQKNNLEVEKNTKLQDAIKEKEKVCNEQQLKLDKVNGYYTVRIDVSE